ncbi:MAG TPA: formylglycine-generating enzyme family protein, partial [Myxococcota bacterium]|nr:formylglycine-generating enzyme family protein [Myxococcota bacterium]
WLWRAVCCLSGLPMADDRALLLRQILRLRVDAWALAQLSRLRSPLVWPEQQRAEVIQWLDRGYGHSRGERAMLDRLIAGLRRLPADPLERALVELWGRPESRSFAEAVATLVALSPDPRITAAIGWLKLRPEPGEPRSRPGGRELPLPWRWSELGELERTSLQKLGLGHRLQRLSGAMLAPGRWRVAAGLLAAASLAAFLLGLREWPCEGGLVLDAASLPTDAWVECEEEGDRSCKVGNLSGVWQTTVPEGMNVEVGWREEERACETMDGVDGTWGKGLRSWCGEGAGAEVTVLRLANLALTGGVPTGSQPEAPIFADTPEVRKLRAALLKGTAEVVLAGDWPESWPAPASGEEEQRRGENGTVFRYLTVEGDPVKLADSLNFPGVKKAAEVPEWRGRVPNDLELVGLGGGCGNGVWEEGEDCDGERLCDEKCTWKVELEWVVVPAGEGKIGDKGCNNCNTGGEFTVRVEQPFLMLATEVTNRQYQAAAPDHPKANTWPVVYVNWEQARSFCMAAGGLLPTEVQWEYAARAGTTTAWYDGEEGKGMGDYAWYDDNANELYPVKGKKPNRWGLFDMYGNAWEWTRDASIDGRWSVYAPLPQPIGLLTIDNTAVGVSPRRVARGGSFVFSRRWLRSAYRVRLNPGDQDGDVGFRCVRALRPGLEP